MIMTSPDRSDHSKPRRRAPTRQPAPKKTHIDVIWKALNPKDHWAVRFLFSLVATLRFAVPVTVIGESVHLLGRHFFG
jgi:nicotinamide riboside transporter PnuC